MFLDFKKLKLNDVKNKISTEQFYQGLVITLVVITLIIFIFAKYQPISKNQFNNIVQISLQQQNLRSFETAQTLLTQPKISKGEYLRLMHLFYVESKSVNQLEPMIIEDDVFSGRKATIQDED